MKVLISLILCFGILGAAQSQAFPDTIEHHRHFQGLSTVMNNGFLDGTPPKSWRFGSRVLSRSEFARLALMAVEELPTRVASLVTDPSRQKNRPEAIQWWRAKREFYGTELPRILAGWMAEFRKEIGNEGVHVSSLKKQIDAALRKALALCDAELAKLGAKPPFPDIP